jgi:molecular chaperone GrpE
MASGHKGKREEKKNDQPSEVKDEAVSNVNESAEKETAGEETLKTEQSDSGDERVKLLREVEELKSENSQLKDQYLRKSADFENYRKRMVKEKQDAVKFSNQELLKDLVEIIDNFERAIKSSEESKDFNAFHQGITLIEQQFTGMLLSKWGLSKIEAVGEEYNPELHEALMTEETATCDKSVVLEDFQTGYRLYDRIIRPSRVKVGIPATSETEDKREADNESDGNPEGDPDNNNRD